MAYYVNVQTRQFIQAPDSSDSHHRRPRPLPCNCKDDRPTFLNYGKRPAPKPIAKPQLTQQQFNKILITFLNGDGTPFDFTDMTILLAVDNDFRHDNDLIALCDNGTIVDAQQGKVLFNVSGYSAKFHKVVESKVPASAVYMEVVCYQNGDPQGIAILQDNGIKLLQRIYSDEGQPPEEISNYYTKVQINSLLKKFKPVDSDSSTGNIINGQGAPDKDMGMPGDFYVDTENKGLYLKGTDDWSFIGYLAMQLPQLQYEILQ